MLFDLVLDEFEVDQRYFYACIILGTSSSKWWKIYFSIMFNSGVISGLRNRSPIVVTKVQVPNNNTLVSDQVFFSDLTFIVYTML